MFHIQLSLNHSSAPSLASSSPSILSLCVSSPPQQPPVTHWPSWEWRQPGWAWASMEKQKGPWLNWHMHKRICITAYDKHYILLIQLIYLREGAGPRIRVLQWTSTDKGLRLFGLTSPKPERTSKVKELRTKQRHPDLLTVQLFPQEGQAVVKDET